MHKYMRSIGFSQFKNFKEEQKLITDIIVNAPKRGYTSLSDNIIIASFSREFAPGVGISVVGQFDEDDQFTYSYYYPYVESTCISSEEDISVDRHAATDSYAGVIDDSRTGVSIIFYLQNMIPYINAVRTDMLPMTGTTLSLSALSDGGTILMPLKKTVKDVYTNQQVQKSRSMLINAAKAGDDEAMENLTLKDMDTYTTIAQRIQTDDVFTLVDTYFMPYGVECDIYAILGEITEVTELKNSVTGEELYKMSLVCNDIEMTLCVNKKDVYGQPEVGRRYKGTIWLQGHINYPMSS
ncbi:MAG: DUF3881 family protein [Lachnospiraceae bacterium]|nr:DUF3881 family protein [Lachnospiraceae bacterium]